MTAFSSGIRWEPGSLARPGGKSAGAARHQIIFDSQHAAKHVRVLGDDMLPAGVNVTCLAVDPEAKASVLRR